MRVQKILSIPKSLYLNFKVFPFKIAIKMPILISYRVKIKGITKNCIKIIDPNIKFGMIKIGFGGMFGVSKNNESFFMICKGGQIIFGGIAEFSEGVSIRIGPRGKLNLGKGFSANKNCSIFCDGFMKIGEDTLVGYNVNIRDSDGHYIYDLLTEDKNPINKNVIIGNHVWIASYVDILKGTEIKDNSVIAYRSCVLSKFDKSNCIIGGYPAKVLRENINWEK